MSLMVPMLRLPALSRGGINLANKCFEHFSANFIIQHIIAFIL